MSHPALVFVPGLWEGARVFSEVIRILDTEHHYPTQALSLPSTGTNGSNAKDFFADVDFIRKVVQDLADKGNEILLIMHSAGAFIGSQAIKDLGLDYRKKHGQAGGVKKLVYLTGALIQEGSGHPPVPFFQTTDDRMRSRDPIPSLFNDFPPAEAEKYAKELSWQPSTYIESVHVSYCAWRDIPSVYLCCTQDRVIPLELQHQLAAMAGAETESCDVGHMVMLSRPERVVEFVKKAAAAET